MARDSDTIELIVDGQPQEVKIFLDKTGPQGPKGDTGNGIESVTKTGTVGLVDTYTILFTDGTSTTFTVTNGQGGSADIHWGDVQGSIANQTDLQNALNAKQNKLTAGANITIDANNVISAAGGSGGGAVDSVNGKTGEVVLTASDVGALPTGTRASDIGGYVKPTNGIPKSDLASAVQTSLNKADTALQSAPVTSVNSKTGAVVLSASDVGAYVKPTGGIPKTDLASAVQTSLEKADTALQSAPVNSVNGKTGTVSLTASDVGALPSTTAIPSKTSDLTNDSGYITSAGAPVQSVNGQTGAVTVTVPTKTSDLQNDSGYITSAPVSSVDGKTGAVTVLPAGGTTGQVLAKASATDRDVEWITPSGGGGGSSWRLINTVTVDADDVVEIEFNTDSDGNPFELEEFTIGTGANVITATGASGVDLFVNNISLGNMASMVRSSNGGMSFRGLARPQYSETFYSSTDTDNTVTKNSIVKIIRYTNLTNYKITSIRFAISSASVYWQNGLTLYFYGR